MAMANSGFGALRAGDLVAAQSVLDEAWRLCEELDHPVSTVAVLSLRGAVAILAATAVEAKVFLLELSPRNANEAGPIEHAGGHGVRAASARPAPRSPTRLRCRRRICHANDRVPVAG